tara:strand:- start:197 stop:1576 length:1380 start_codon:yes stop_codon:yes gene_type:complete
MEWVKKKMTFEYALIGLGSNIGLSKLDNLSNSLYLIKNNKNISVHKVSSTYFSNAQLPANAPKSWSKDFFNAAILISTSLSPDDLLLELKQIEKKSGRVAAPDWSPRVIDLDILFYGDYKIKNSNLNIPHEHVFDRPFALVPAYEIIPKDMRSYFFQEKSNLVDNIIEKHNNDESIGFNTHKINQRIDNSKLMKIINVTPDSFSENNKNLKNISETIEKQIQESILDGAHIIDIGAEATNPNIKYDIKQDLEWLRLDPVLNYIKKNKNIWSNKYGVRFSLDTRNHRTLSKSLSFDCIDFLNDVSGLCCKKMQSIVKDSQISAIFMHSITVPADKSKIISFSDNPVSYIYNWAINHLEYLINIGISKDKLIFDPGIGFGKNSLQSHDIIRNFNIFKKLGIQLLLGHSRKSWLNNCISSSNSSSSLDQKDALTAVSSILTKEADILRVHNVKKHLEMFKLL